LCNVISSPTDVSPNEKSRLMRRRVPDRWVLRHFLYFILHFSLLYSTLLHLPPFRFHCVGGCWDLTQDSCDLGLAVRHFNHSARSHPPRLDIVGSDCSLAGLGEVRSTPIRSSRVKNKSIRDTMYTGRIVQGTLCPRDASSQGHIVHGTQHPTVFVFGTYRSGTLYHVIVLKRVKQAIKGVELE
jgi:hypothetical protein